MHKDTSGSDDVGVNDESNDAPDVAGDERSLTRRRLVAAGAATWATVSVAGCQYITDPGTDTPTETDTPTVTTETTTTDEPVAPTTSGDNETGSAGETPADGETPTPTETDSPTPTPTEQPTTTACASIGRFAPGMEVGLHVSIFDPATGEPLDDDAVDSVIVEFPDADYGPLELNWEGDHEAYDDETWGSKIRTDGDTDPGTYEYEVTVEADEDDETTVTDRFTIV